MPDKLIFNNIIADYALGRPGYPTDLFQDIIKYSSLDADAKILEIGSGPGQATEYFVKNGFSTTGLEIGDRQVQYLSGKFAGYGNFNAICSSFEEYEYAENTYDLIFSATAFHWIDPKIGYPKAYELLKNGGALAVFWHMSSVIRQCTEMLDEIYRIFRKYAPELDTYISREEAEDLHSLRISQIESSHLFSNLEHKRYKWVDAYTAERYINLMNSFSDMYDIDEEKRDRLLSNIYSYIKGMNGIIHIPQEVWLYMVRR